MKEHQQLEWKEAWKNEVSQAYLESIGSGMEGGAQSEAQFNDPVTAPISDYVRKLLCLLRQREPLGNEDIRLAFGLKSSCRLRETYLAPALSSELIEYTLPDKPNSRLRKYRLTERGRAWLSRNQP